MAFRVLTRADVEQLLTPQACIEIMSEALTALARGEMSQPLRSVFVPPDAAGLMAWMPAHRSGERALFGMKILSVIPDNPRRGLDGHQGAVVLLDGVTGELRALMDASAITAIRTAAVSAVATRHMAREDARTLAIVGSGTQARRHLETIPLVRPIARARVASRTPGRCSAPGRGDARYAVVRPGGRRERRGSRAPGGYRGHGDDRSGACPRPFMAGAGHPCERGGCQPAHGA